jgi:SAM-dependent methyltransferase
MPYYRKCRRARSRWEGDTVDDDFWQTLPNEFDAQTYRSLYPDLVHMTDPELLAHYKEFGRKEGRTANNLRDRNDFVALVPKSATVLEIGPFCNPLLRGPSVSYLDILSQEALVARASSLGLDPSGVPYIDYISPTGELSIVKRRFDVVISSHCLEHQPDFAAHVQGVGQLLLSGGAYFLLVPDKRYCFDHFIPTSNLAEVIVAHYERRKVHTLRSVIEHRALTTHNDSPVIGGATMEFYLRISNSVSRRPFRNSTTPKVGTSTFTPGILLSTAPPPFFPPCGAWA